MTNAKTENMQGEPWKNERFLGSFQEADTLRKSLKAQDKTGTLQFKIKRCGIGGTTYVVKSRIDPNLKAALEEIEEKMMKKKDKKAAK
mgnify:CR=1 FL=1